jgi:hypothetical protein
MTNWCISLPGDPAWWQAATGLFQALLALAIWRVTRRYVDLTAELVRLQADVVRLQKQTERRELYDRRLRVYDATKSFLAEFARSMEIDIPAILQLYRDTREAEFLFEPAATDLIQEIAKRASEHRTIRMTHQDPIADQTALNRMHELESWLVETAFAETRRIMGRDLELNQPGPASAPEVQA